MCYCDVKSRDFLLRDTSSERFCRLRDSGLRDMRSDGLFFAGSADGFRAVTCFGRRFAGCCARTGGFRRPEAPHGRVGVCALGLACRSAAVRSDLRAVRSLVRFRGVRRPVARLPGAMLPERGMSAVCVVWRREGSVPAVSGRGGEGRSDSAVGRVRASGCRFLA